MNRQEASNKLRAWARLVTVAPVLDLSPYGPVRLLKEKAEPEHYEDMTRIADAILTDGFEE